VSARLITVVLVGLLLAVQADFWFGKGGLPRSLQLQSQLDAQRKTNEAARLRNARVSAEVRDLKDGLEMVEERARADLGMVRPDEILVQVSAARR
jgi:cell division protein FtsB